jgi:dipeptidyl aminopeptidase/acylaminoacyl peptidase
VILKGNRDPENGFGAVIFAADLEDKGMRLNNARRLTAGGNAYAHDWTPDSQAIVFESERNGRYGLFKQRLDRSAAESLVAGSENTAVGHFSPDGSWFLYVAGNSASENRLMRMPASGGPSEGILDGRDMQNYYCTAAAANMCVIGKREQGQLVSYVFDPAQRLPPGGIRGAICESSRERITTPVTGVSRRTVQALPWSVPVTAKGESTLFRCRIADALAEMWEQGRRTTS